MVEDNAMIYFHTNKTVIVSGFIKFLRNITKVSIVEVVVVYTDMITGITYLLVIKNTL